MTTILLLALYSLGLYFIAVVERWSVAGRWQWAAPIAGATSLMRQENVRPQQRDKVFYESAPLLFLAAVFLAFAVLPLSRGAAFSSLSTGALFLNAALAYVMVALLMAGWAANGAYAMIGGWRFLGQLTAYSMPIVMAITATVMRAESMALDKIVESQSGLWNIAYQPLGFLLFYLASLALAFLPPFDLPQARGELAGGVFAAYTGWRMALIRFARLVLILTLSLSVTALFLGGWQGPLIPPFAWLFLKTITVACSFFFVGRYVSRVQHYTLLEASWKIATPLALLNIFWVGVLLLI